MAMYKCGTTGLLRPVADIDMLASVVETAYSQADSHHEIFLFLELLFSHSTPTVQLQVIGKG